MSRIVYHRQTMVLEAISLGCLASAVAATLWAIRRAIARLPREETRCAGCLMPARGMTDFVCPGCGRDVREQGLERPAASPAGPVLRWMLAALMYVAVVAMVVQLGFGGGPKRYAAKYDVTWEPKSRAYRSLSQETTFDADAERILHGTSRWVLRTHDGGWGVMQVELPSLRYRVTDLAGQSLWEGTELDTKAVTRWMQEAGVTITPAVEAEIQEHVGKTRGWAWGRATNSQFISRTLSNGGGGGGTSGYSQRWPRNIALVVSSAGWMLLVVVRELSSGHRRSGQQAPAEMLQ